jgi:hypothetical protein
MSSPEAIKLHSKQSTQEPNMEHDMLNRTGLIQIMTTLLTFFIVSVSAEEIIVPEAVRTQITDQVINEQGYFDAAEIEVRTRLWQLDQPQPDSSGELIGEGNCGLSCTETGGNATLPKPRNVEIKGQ